MNLIQLLSSEWKEEGDNSGTRESLTLGKSSGQRKRSKVFHLSRDVKRLGGHHQVAKEGEGVTWTAENKDRT